MPRRAPRNSAKTVSDDVWSWSDVEGLSEEDQADKVNGESVETETKTPLKPHANGSMPKKAMTLDPNLPLQGLTSKQEQFALLFVAGHAKSEAYRQAYNVGKDTKPESVYRRAVDVAANVKVRARIQQLKERQEGKFSHSFEQIRGHVLDTWFEILLDDKATATARLKAGELLAKVPGVDILKDESADASHRLTPDQLKAEILDGVRGLLQNAGDNAQVIENTEDPISHN